jgi:hypothetical protein
MLHLNVTPQEPTCPCHHLPLCGGPARVWCRISGRQFQGDDPRLRPAERRPRAA